MKPITIHLDALSTGYLVNKRPKVIAQALTADLHSGELTCLVGANGVGKSTLLRTLSAFQPPLGGKIELLGKALKEHTDAQLAKVISVVLTEKCDVRNMTVRELVGLGRSPYTGFWGRLSPHDVEVVNGALSLVNIHPLAQRMIQTLSDGERQKVMIAKALAQETPIIFLDEPTAFLDYPSKVEIMQLLHRLAHTVGKTVFLSTHDLELALQIADKLWLMDGSHGIAIGTPEDLALEGKLSEFFGRKEIRFDTATGLYRIATHFHHAVTLRSTEEVRYAMVSKALQRIGIAVCSTARVAIDDNLTLRLPHETLPCHNIEELLNVIDLHLNELDPC